MGKFDLGIEVPENENSQAFFEQKEILEMEGPRADHLGTDTCQSSQASILGDFKIREFKLATSSEIACVDFLLGFLLEEQMTLQPRHCHLLPA